MTRTVLILAPDFAPSSFPPALRVRFFSNHLADFGWKPLVLTVAPENYETPIDDANLDLVASSVEVIQTQALPARLTRWFGFGDLGLRSLFHLQSAASRLCRQRAVDLIFIPVPPYYTMIQGRLLKARHGIPFVVDYIDPWVVEDYFRMEPHLRPPKWRLAYWVSRLLEPLAVRPAAGIVGVSEGTIASVVDRYPEFEKLPSAILPYGAEARDFDYLRQSPRLNPCFEKDDELFYLCYTGAFIPGMFDTARALFKALGVGLAKSPELFDRIRILFIGSSYGGSEERHAERLAREEGVAQFVREYPPRVSYLDACQILLDADALLALGSDAPHYTPSKIFPYLLAQKPILAIFHSASSLIQILEGSGAGTAVPFSPESLANQVPVIQARLTQLLSGSLPFVPLDEAKFAAYSARAMASGLARFFDDCLSLGSAGEGPRS